MKKRGSKMENLSYKEIKIKEYLVSEKLTLPEKKVLFKLRTNMAPVSSNFGDKNKTCPACFIACDNQQHLIECVVIKCLNKTVLYNQASVEYMDIFSEDLSKLKEAAKIFAAALKTRQSITS